MLTNNKTSSNKLRPFSHCAKTADSGRVVSALWKGCRGIWKLAGRLGSPAIWKPPAEIPDEVDVPAISSVILDILLTETDLWREKSFPVFSNISNVQLHNLKRKGKGGVCRAQGNPIYRRLFVYSLCCDMTQLFIKKWQLTDTLTISANSCCLLRRKQSYLWWYCPPDTNWMDLWTLLNYFSTG